MFMRQMLNETADSFESRNTDSFWADSVVLTVYHDLNVCLYGGDQCLIKKKTLVRINVTI